MSSLIDLWTSKEERSLPAYQRLRHKVKITMVVLGTALVAYVPLFLLFPLLNIRPIFTVAILALSATLFYWMSPETKALRKWRKAGKSPSTESSQRGKTL